MKWPFYAALMLGGMGLLGIQGGSAPVPVEREAPWRIANFSKDAGVLRRMVFDVAFATNNTVWCAVSDGLYRYDGYHWKRFTTTNGLPSNFIRTVVVLRDGSLWVGTDKGAGSFDGVAFNRRGTEGKLAGANVRRIVETAEGALWFCCDRWPDPTSTGGLTHFKQDIFRTYGLADGLPSDHVLDFFVQSTGRQIVLTSAGPAVRAGERWTPLVDEGYPPNDHTWMMQETPDGCVYAQAYNSTFRLDQGRWLECHKDGAPDNAPFCVTHEGNVIKGLRDPGSAISFARWNGQEFVQASAEVPDQGLSLEVLRQAPDGSIWAVGRGTILRWEYMPGSWQWWPDLPQPAFEDHRHRLWFADQTGSAVLDQERIQKIPELRAPLVVDNQGAVWSGATNGLIKWTDGQIEYVAETTCGLTNLLAGTAAASGGIWLHGHNRLGASVVAACHSNGWKVIGPEALGGRRVLSIARDPLQGAWMVLVQEYNSAFEVAKASVDGIKIVALEGPKPNLHLPRLCASQTHLFLYAYNGLWEAPLGEPLRFKPAATGTIGVLTAGTATGELAAFVTQEGLDGNAAIMLRRQHEWFQHRVSYGEALWLGHDGWLMAADGAEFVLWHTRQWNSATYVSLPTETTITSMVRSTSGDYWLGTYDGVLKLEPKPIQPDTLLTGPTMLFEGNLFPVRAVGVTPFAPRSKSTRYSFSWRLDSGPWSNFEDWPAQGIPLENLRPGQHRLEAVARDGLGNADPTPASLAFELLPVPLQDRRWFRLGLTGTGLAFAGLSAALFGAIRRLRRHSNRLEEQVQARTAQLSRDIARREEAEQKLLQSEKRFRALVEQGAEAIALIDPEGRILYEGPTVTRLTGYTQEERLGQNAITTVHPEDQPAVKDILTHLIAQPGAQQNAVFRSLRKDGSVWWTEGTATNLLHEPLVRGIVVNFRDITERRRAEEAKDKIQAQLVQAQKMESVGRLAGGVAHDFNNMLQVILGNVSLALNEENLSASVIEHLEEIQKVTWRSSELTHQLLAFARKQTVSPKILDLNDTVAGMLKMLRRLIGENIKLAWLPGPNLWPVKLDPSQLDQVLANLVVNARDAIDGVGAISIQTSTASLDPGQAEIGVDFVPGDYVVLTVSDTGRGMNQEVQEHLFEPFFTTKEMGKGTGLGLATVYGIVKQNGGFIQVQSQPGQGATFSLYLPRAEVPKVSAAAEAELACPRGTETLLLVEDEPSVLKLGQRLLEGLGYRVLAASTPSEAFRLVCEHTGHIQLLITDVIMPEANGRDLAKRLQTVVPNLRCLFVSGYTDEVIAHHGLLEEGVHFIQKPFSQQDLALHVRAALEAKR